MAWDESKAWIKGRQNQRLYQGLLEDAAGAPARNAKRKKIVHPEDMPWELSRQGLLKHLLNEGMNTRMETVDAYMLVIAPGSRSGKHRHLAEECLYVLEGRGYELHQDCDVDPERPVRLISATNRIYKACGLNDLEQMEDAPEYVANTVVTPELVEKFLKAKVAA